MKNRPTFYVTTPIYYVNSKPHVGTLYSTLLADVTARWNRLCGKEVFFLTGTDEHGQKIEEKAKEMGKDPKTFVDSMIPPFKDMWKLYNIDYTRFIRTTDIDHEQAVTAWVSRLHEQGDIYKSIYTGWYCVPCESFVSQDDAMKAPHCPSCSRPLKQIEEENYFFRLSAYEDRLLEFYEKYPDFITPRERLNEVVSFVKSGLKDLSISRKGVAWGIPFPADPSHTIYVWADALFNYISALGYSEKTTSKDELFERFWPVDVQVMAKDIVRFHAVYWPAFLMASGFALPKKLVVHGFILADHHKMSKSLGNAIDPAELATSYGVDAIRYYLLRQMSLHQDGNFDRVELEMRIASDLSNNLGNLVQRMIALAVSNGITTAGAIEIIDAPTEQLHVRAQETLRMYKDQMNHYEYHLALAELWRFISEINAYVNDQKPWMTIKENRKLFQTTLSAVCHSLYMVAVVASPIMPKKMEELLGYLGERLDPEKNMLEEFESNQWDKKFILTKPSKPLFVRPEMSASKSEDKEGGVQIDKKPAIPTITIDEFSQIHLVAGTILSCETVSGSDKLYKLMVDCGSYGIRQILSGIRTSYSPEELVGKQGVYVLNLAVRKMMGLESAGMMLFAKDKTGVLKMATIAGAVENGSRLS